MEKIPVFENVLNDKSEKEVEQPRIFSSLGKYMDKYSARALEAEMLKPFSREQRRTIKKRQEMLSSLAYFIGKNFSIQVTLGSPSRKNPSGWQWGIRESGERYIQMNVHDLLEKPIDFLRYVVSHEGGHERVSRTDFIPPDVWSQPGFDFMMNAIEDPRMNNFVSESYPTYRKWMLSAYKDQLGFEEKGKEIAEQRLGFQPKHMQAGFEYIKQWLKEEKGEEFSIDERLPEEVKEVVKKTLTAAARSWKVFPSRDMADGKKTDELGFSGESSIVAHARASYEINRDEVWPEFRKLIEQDIDDQKTQEALNDMKGQEGGEGGQGEGGEGGRADVPKELKDKLSPKELKELEDAIDGVSKTQEKKESEAQKEGGADKAPDQEKEEGESQKEGDAADDGEAGGGEEDKKIDKPIPLDSLSEELKDKIKEYIESLPEEKKKEIQERAERAIKEFDESLNDELQGKLKKESEKQKKESEESGKQDGKDKKGEGAGDLSANGAFGGELPQDPIDKENRRAWSDRLRKEIEKDANLYEKTRREVLLLIDKTEADLRRILIEDEDSWQTGHKTGKKIDIQRRIQEKAKDVSVLDSKAWQKREHPREKGHAFTVLVDLSGSMREKDKNIRKIDETFKSVIVFAEALNRLGINTEVVGFNDDFYEYQNFEQPMSSEIREKMSKMPKEVDASCCSGCGNEHSETDLGWAIQTAMERLLKQKQDNKMLIVLTDGQLAESPKHPHEKYNPEKIKKQMIEQTDVIPLDLGSVAGKNVDEIVEEIKKLIENKKA